MGPRSSTRLSMSYEETDPWIQGDVEQGREEGVPLADVGLPPRSGELDTRGAAGVRGPVPEDPEAEGAIPGPGPLQGELRHGHRSHHGGAMVEATPPRDRRLGTGPRGVLRDQPPKDDRMRLL